MKSQRLASTDAESSMKKASSPRNWRIVQRFLCSWCFVTVEAFHYNQRFRTTCTPPFALFHGARHMPTVSIASRLKHTHFNSPSDENSASRERQNSEKNKAFLVLFTVPLAWGTFEPAVRLVYQYQPNIPPFVFSFSYYLVASVALGVIVSQVADEPDLQEQESGDLGMDDGNISAVKGGIELGTYLFVGNALQVIGLKTVPSDRAAFLLQLTTIFVPLVQSLLASNLSIIPAKTWLAALVALFGVGLIGLDGNRTTGDDSNAISFSVATFTPENLDFSTGDLYIILGAVFYTFHCIRLELYARSTSAIRLAAAKATTEAAWSTLALVVCVSASMLPAPEYKMSFLDTIRGSGDDVIAYLQTLDHDEGDPHWVDVGVATLWIGLVTVAYTIYAQSFGQSKVPAATANLIYTIQPFFTALVAFVVLGERLGPYGYVGGSLIGAAVLLVVADEDENTTLLSTPQCDDDSDLS